MASSENVFYEAVLKLVKEAGVIIRQVFEQPKRVEVMTKSSAVDLVTETDQRVEKLLVDGLRRQFPDHKFIGEESAADGQAIVFTDDPTWIIDPIDGTTNFVHRLPFVCVSIALYVEKKPRIGIVFNPILNELFTARIGQGAFRNGFPIHVSGTKEMSKAIIISTVGSQRKPHIVESYVKSFEAFVAANFRGHRSFGSAAINMCYVAMGAADAYIEYGLHCWDSAAAALIVTEAGGTVVDPTGSPFELMSRRVLSTASAELANQMSTACRHVEFDKEG